MKLILQNGQQFRRPPELLHPLTSDHRWIFCGEKHSGMAAVSRRLGWGPHNFPSTAYQSLQGFPFRPSTEDSSTGRENVKFRSFEINSAPRDCATFTRLEYLASRDIPGLYQSFRIPQTSIPRYASHRGKRDRRENIRFSRRGLSRATDVSFLLFNVFPA